MTANAPLNDIRLTLQSVDLFPEFFKHPGSRLFGINFSRW